MSPVAGSAALHGQALTRFGSAAWATALAAAVVATAPGCGIAAPQAPSAEVGDCLDMAGVEQAQVSEIPTVDCAQKHDGQVVHAFEMRDGDYPDDREWSTAIEEGCTEGFEDVVGIAYAESELMVQDLSPTRESWEAGDRQVLCLAFLTGETTSTSFEGSEL